MRLIDGDKFRLALLILRDAAYTVSGNTDAVDKVLDMLDKQETVDTVKHGHWEESKCLDDYFWVCSCCKFPSQAVAAPKLYKYCPGCGARMDGDAND